MELLSKREKYLVINSLSCLPLYFHGRSVLIDLKNEISVAGRIGNADGSMNITLVDVVLIDRNGMQYPFEELMIRERTIRQIHIRGLSDDEFKKWMENGLQKSSRTRKTNTKRTFKVKRAEVRHKEILNEIYEKKSL